MRLPKLPTSGATRKINLIDLQWAFQTLCPRNNFQQVQHFWKSMNKPCQGHPVSTSDTNKASIFADARTRPWDIQQRITSWWNGKCTKIPNMFSYRLPFITNMIWARDKTYHGWACQHSTMSIGIRLTFHDSLSFRGWECHTVHQPYHVWVLFSKAFSTAPMGGAAPKCLSK